VHAEARCRIFAVVEAGPSALARVGAALAAGDVAALLVVPDEALPLGAAAVAPLVAAAQRADVAALIAGDAQLAEGLGADGLHVRPARDIADQYGQARRRLGAGAIVGADCGVSRHDAMSLAEAGADYIAFGAPRHLNDRARGRSRRDALVTWWGEIFEVPCVALDVESAEEAKALSAAGADFIGVALEGAPAAVGALFAQIHRAIVSDAS
jgi:thiamine-phosphate pyrophosphorylase